MLKLRISTAAISHTAPRLAHSLRPPRMDPFQDSPSMRPHPAQPWNAPMSSPAQRAAPAPQVRGHCCAIHPCASRPCASAVAQCGRWRCLDARNGTVRMIGHPLGAAARAHAPMPIAIMRRVPCRESPMMGYGLTYGRSLVQEKMRAYIPGECFCCQDSLLPLTTRARMRPTVVRRRVGGLAFDEALVPRQQLLRGEQDKGEPRGLLLRLCPSGGRRLRR